MNLKAFAHVAICTRDLAQTEKYYCDGLGLRKIFEFEKNGQPSGFYLQISEGNFLEFFLDVKAYGDDSPLRHLCFETADIQALRRHLLAKDIACGEISLGGDASLQFWTKDPNGIPVEFHQYTKDSSQFTGKPVLMTW